MLRFMHKLLLILFTSLGLLGLPTKGQAQTEVINNAKAAIRTGNSKDLTKYFNSLVELKIDDTNENLNAASANSNFSKTHAEYVLKDFFKDNPPQNFEYVHEGTSKEGLKYTIGKYTYRDKNNKQASFRVFMKIKQYGSDYLIDAIDFSKEEEGDK
jgi:hypothetical protein